MHAYNHCIISYLHRIVKKIQVSLQLRACCRNMSLWSRCLLGYFSIPPIIWMNVEHRWMVNLEGNVEIPVPVPFAYRKFQWTAKHSKPDLQVMRSADRHLNHGLSVLYRFWRLNSLSVELKLCHLLALLGAHHILHVSIHPFRMKQKIHWLCLLWNDWATVVLLRNSM